MGRKSVEHRRDPYYKKAKQKGYRARSAFKLLEIQKKFNIFKRAFYILDLGCSPGSWLQVAKKLAEENLDKYNDQYYHRDHYKIMGVDIKKTTPIEKIKIIKEDFTQPKFTNELNAYFSEKLDLILSDASIKKSGNKFSDHLRQIKLGYKIIEIMNRYLKHNGNIIIKVFQGIDFKNFFEKLKQQFKYIKSYKPRSSKKTSNEIYIIGLQKL